MKSLLKSYPFVDSKDIYDAGKCFLYGAHTKVASLVRKVSPSPQSSGFATIFFGLSSMYVMSTQNQEFLKSDTAYSAPQWAY